MQPKCTIKPLHAADMLSDNRYVICSIIFSSAWATMKFISPHNGAQNARKKDLVFTRCSAETTEANQLMSHVCNLCTDCYMDLLIKQKSHVYSTRSNLGFRIVFLLEVSKLNMWPYTENMHWGTWRNSHMVTAKWLQDYSLMLFRA